MTSSPYLKTGRLSDVIAAITTLGTYKFYKLDSQGWADRISGRQKSADHWISVFREHPEFFRQAAENENTLWFGGGSSRATLTWMATVKSALTTSCPAKHMIGQVAAPLNHLS